MDKKEINSPKLTEHFLFWMCGIGGLLLAHFSSLISSTTSCEAEPRPSLTLVGDMRYSKL